MQKSENSKGCQQLWKAMLLYKKKGTWNSHPTPCNQINPIMGQYFCGQQSSISFAQAERNAATGVLQTRSRTAVWLVHSSFWVLLSSKCRSEGEECLTFLRVGAGCPASSTFPRAAAATTSQGVFEVVMVTTWPGQMISAVVAEITGAPIKTSWLSWPRVSFFPHLDQLQRTPLAGACSHVLEELLACIAWGRRRATLQSVNYKFLRVTHVPQKHGIVFRIFFKSF